MTQSACSRENSPVGSLVEIADIEGVFLGGVDMIDGSYVISFESDAANMLDPGEELEPGTVGLVVGILRDRPDREKELLVIMAAGKVGWVFPDEVTVIDAAPGNS
jgi:hypothetical protein